MFADSLGVKITSKGWIFCLSVWFCLLGKKFTSVTLRFSLPEGYMRMHYDANCKSAK